jgi:predicted TIM-barrel fold metal-dependent hydrolase
MSTNTNRIDLHHHVIAPQLAAALLQRGIDWTGGSGIPPWSMASALESMDRLGIAAAVASVHPDIDLPGLGDTNRWAREGNEFLARVVSDDPQHFGGLASLPLPDPDAACREVEYALDVLKLDGVYLLSSQGGQYPGDPALEELFHELNRRSAVVVFHPAINPPGSDQLKVSFPTSLVEFVFDTTRAIANLLYTGTLARYPAIRYVVPHAGGTIPYLARRIEMGAVYSSKLKERVPDGPLTYLRKLYYDTAVSASDVTLAALLQFVPSTRIVYGSDFPHVPGPVIDALTKTLDTSSLLDDAAHAAINRGNALKLFPRFASVSAQTVTK